MARTVSLADLRTALQRETDLPEIGEDTFVTTSEANQYLNDAAYDLTALLSEVMPGGYLDTSATTSTVANTATLDLPNDFYQLRNVWHSVDNSLVPLEEWRDDRRTIDLQPKAWSSGTRIRYRLKANTLEFDPIPSGAYSVRMDYVPIVAVMVDDADTFDVRIGWDRYIVLTAAIRVLTRQELPIQEMAALLGKVEDSIRRQAPQRDGARIHRQRNVYDRRDFDMDDLEGSWRDRP